MKEKYVIATKNLTKVYGDQVSVSSLDLHVRRGKIYGLLGRNGAGKTTTMRMLLGLTEPTQGTIRLSQPDGNREFECFCHASWHSEEGCSQRIP